MKGIRVTISQACNLVAPESLSSQCPSLRALDMYLYLYHNFGLQKKNESAWSLQLAMAFKPCLEWGTKLVPNR